MVKNFTFRCYKCKKHSKYLHPADKGNDMLKMMTMDDRDKTQTYYCEHCKMANQITLKESQWMLLDLKKIEIPD